jgi:Uma2 family endonuclease
MDLLSWSTTRPATSQTPSSIAARPVARDSLIAPNPVIVVEVLSPSTRNLDKAVKLADYFRVPGLAHYLIIDLGRRHVLHYGRRSDGVVTVVIVKNGEIALDPLGIEIPVASLFA